MNPWRWTIFFIPLLATFAWPQAQVVSARSSVSEFEVNGLKVILKQRPGTQTVAVGLFVRGGAANLTVANAGIEELLLNVASEGSVKFPRALLRSELARTGSTIGYSTSYDYSVLSMGCLREYFERTWDIFADFALHPSLVPEHVELGKRRQIAELQNRMDSPDELLELSEASAIYAGHPYANDFKGTLPSMARMTPAELKLYHSQIMQTSRLLLVVVGDLDLYGLKSRVAASFGALPRGNYQASSVPLLKFSAAEVKVIPRALPVNYVQGIYSGPEFKSKDFAALQVATSILSDRVYTQVRVKRGLSYAPSAFLRAQSVSVGGIYFTSLDVNQTAGIMLKEVTALKQTPVSADELVGVVSQYVTTYYVDNQTSAAQAAMLARYELIGGGWRNADTVLERLRAVTPVDVQRVARQYMRNLQFTVVGDDSHVSKQALMTEP